MNPVDWIGHGTLQESLQNAMMAGRLAHACIFDGTAGIGKSTMARWAAAWLFCESEGERPCGHCSACVKLDSDNHPDLLVICPEENSIKNHQVEAFQEYLQVKPYLASGKVIIMEDADTMTVSAQNRLLKVLEEPPAGTHIFLITTRFNRLVPTILSRCQILRFGDLNPAGIASYLTNHYNIDRPRAEHLAHRSGGSLGRALALMQDDGLNRWEPLISGFIDGYARGGLMDLLNLADQYESEADWETILEWLVYEGNQRLRAVAAENDTESARKWVRFSQHLEDALRALREQANGKVVLDVMILRLMEVSND